MDRQKIKCVRMSLGLSQTEFGQLVGAHAMTVSKWERGLLSPTAYQAALLEKFALAAQSKSTDAGVSVKRLLVGSGATAALAWLLAP
jgi:DNA-binding XRE family transcriptional regulator